MAPEILILNRYGDEHISRVAAKLSSMGAEYVWLDPAEFPSKAQLSVEYGRSGIVRRLLWHNCREIDLSAIRIVWDRWPAEPKAEAEISDPSLRSWAENESRMFLAGLWDTFQCFWVPGNPGDVRAAYEKLYNLAVAAQVGFRIPRTRIGNRPQDIAEIYETFDGRFVSKALGNQIVNWKDEKFANFTHVMRRRDMANYAAVRYAPVIFQEYVAKKLELRITVVGTQVFAAEIHSQATRSTRDDWRHYDFYRTPCAAHQLPDSIKTLCVALLRALRLCFGAIDMVLTPDGEYVFLEINPNGQWVWIEALTQLPIADAIADLLVHTGIGNKRELLATAI